MTRDGVAISWHTLESRAVADQLGTDPDTGLTTSEAARRLAADGPNTLAAGGARRVGAIVWDQVSATMMVVLFSAAAISAALGDYTGASAILAVVVLNAGLGFVQEFRADRAMAALTQLAVPHVTVRRDGRLDEISAVDLVVGDVMLLEAGNVVAADGRLVDVANLRVQESALTGESQPVDKQLAALSSVGDAATIAVGDRLNMVFMGTAVANGRGRAVVTGTGMRTELGTIAEMLQSVRREPTPLQRRLDQLGRRFAMGALAIVATMFGLGLARGEDLTVMFLTAVSMAVAAVPEGLPAVVTIALALGAQRMLRRRALIRKLAAVETLGSVTVICSDKTGTLTENRMRAAVLDVAGRREALTEGATVRLERWMQKGSEPTADHPATSDPELGLALLLAGSALCNDATLAGDGAAGVMVGDPTETALLQAAEDAGMGKVALERQFPRGGEVPFDSERKRMTTVHALPSEPVPLAEALRGLAGDTPPTHVGFTKGAADQLLGITDHVWAGATREPLDAAWIDRIARANEHLARDGMRVLGLGVRLFDTLPDQQDPQSIERELTFIGLIGMVDPPRPEVKAAVATCAAAGIRAVMITGDHPLTASYIAGQLGITTDDRTMTGVDLDGLSPERLTTAIGEVRVYARVSPAHKLTIVEALQRQGQVVAMTGDGVNDAPALRKAHIGVAMGITGSDVSKEAADMVLLDDNFATLVAAVEEGRVIYDNIRKFVKYLLTTNSSELWLMLVAPFLGMPLPLLPLQILWINLVTDGPTALTLGVEPAERAVMQRPPYPPAESIFARGLGVHVLWVGTFMAAITVSVGYGYWVGGHDEWQTMVFTTLAFAQMAHVLAIRSSRDSLFRIGVWSNPWLATAVAGTVALQLGIIYVPMGNRVFGTRPLSGGDLAVAALAAGLVFVAVEVEKWLKRRRPRLLASPALPVPA